MVRFDFRTDLVGCLLFMAAIEAILESFLLNILHVGAFVLQR